MKKFLLYTGIVGIAGAVGFHLYRQYKLALHYSIAIKDKSFTHIAEDLVEVLLTITLTNKSSIAVRIKELDLQVYLSTKKVGKIQNNSEIAIAADSSSDVQLTISFNPQAVFTKDVVVSLVSNLLSKQDIDVDVVGNMKVSGLFGWTKIPVDYSSTGRNLYQLYKSEFA